jgi:hypothetical protein
MPEDPHWVVLGALGHRQMRTAHKNNNKKKRIKRRKNILKSVKMVRRIGTQSR